MDYDNGKAHQQWEWQREEFGLQKQSNYDGSASLWCSEVTHNEEDISYMFDEEATTPVKACGDLALYVGQNEWKKDSLECNVSFSQMKRRRMLQFNNEDDEDIDSSLFCKELSPAFLKSNEGVDSIEEAITADWAPSFEENSSASMYEEALDQSAEWIRDCFIDTEMHCSPETANSPGVPASELPTEVTELCKISPSVNSVPRRPVSSLRKIIIKGKKSFIRAPSKLPSSVAYPFAFIKPSGAHGDVTLKDINQKIRSPPPQKAKQKEEDPVIIYPTSAFSGKPVVGKTKIRMEGGKGSITIMRTKG